MYNSDMPSETISKTTGYAPTYSRFHLGESAAIYLGHTFREFALSLIGIFVPIYIFTLPNLPVLIQNHIINAMLWTFTYYSVESIASLFVTSLLTNIVFNKIKFKGSIALSSLILGTGLLALSLIPLKFGLFFVAAILTGSQIFFYWVPYHILFIRKTETHNGRYGEGLGIRVFLSRIVRTIGPLVGGIFISLYGFQVVFYIGIILLVFSSIPIILAVSEHKHIKHDPFAVFKDIKMNKKLINPTLAIASIETETGIWAILWPITLFIGLESFTKVGYITSISLLISAFVAIMAGKLIDKHGENKIIKVGAPIASLLYIPRAFVLAPFALYGIDILDRITGSVYGMPYMAKIYELAQKTKYRSDFILHREITKRVAFLVAFLIIFPFLYYTGQWRMIFIMVSFFPIITLLITKE